jgi:hypothetical protein
MESPTGAAVAPFCAAEDFGCAPAEGSPDEQAAVASEPHRRHAAIRNASL